MSEYGVFNVEGAGEIHISLSKTWKCGKARGHDFGVSWGEHGKTGGVIDREEALRLAEFIMNASASAGRDGS